MTLRPAVCRVLALALLVSALAVPAANAAPAANPRPATIPALQQWTGGTGAFTFRPTSRIVLSRRDASALATTGATFASDLTALEGFPIRQTVGGPGELRPGDIYLALGSTDAGLGAEGYAMSVTDRVAITARTDAGVFDGTRSVLQLLHQSSSIPRGAARDWPSYPERGLMVDDGRKFFTLAWLEDQVRDLAYLKMNYLHLHLSDNLGFRIESDTHPEIVSADHLSKADVRALLAVAAAYHVMVVPEFDMPGHMDTVLTAHPDLRMAGANGSGYIDLSKDGSYSLMKDLITEYLPLFPAPYFHIGADEYDVDYAANPQILAYAKQKYGPNAIAKDAYLGFVNWADDLVKAAGKTTRAWNDGIGGGSAVTVNPDVILEFWYNYGLSPQQHVDNGHLIMNASYDPTYYVLGGGAPNVQADYETWTPNVFQGNQALNAASVGKNLGSKVHVWCDNPAAQTQDQIAAGIKNVLRVVAQQTWGSPKLVPAYGDFQTVIDTIGRNPAWPNKTQPGNLAYDRPTTVSSTEVSSFPGSNAVDGDYGTRWSSAYTDNQWITVDLGSTHAVHRVKLTWEPAYGKGYQIQTSADGTAWTTIYSTTAGVGGTEDLTGLSGSGRYVRMQGTQRATGYGYSLYEFEVYAS